MRGARIENGWFGGRGDRKYESLDGDGVLIYCISDDTLGTLGVRSIQILMGRLRE
jgi:hypothetical protein